MMKYIAHRGNIKGPNPRENEPLYLNMALDLGYDVETDIRYIGNEFYLGHDSISYHVNESFIMKPNVWFHAKDIKTFHRLLLMGVNTFFHKTDDVVLTTKGYLWTYPGAQLTTRSIAVMPETLQNDTEYVLNECSGVCSDYIQYYKEFLDEKN